MNKKNQASLNNIISRQRNIINEHTPFAVTEAYKSIRTNLLFTQHGGGCQKIAVTSSLAGEGKTVNCINLAITLAQNGLRVLIIDADMRHTMVQKTFNVKAKSGLSELLAGISPMQELFTPDGPIIKLSYHNLFMITAGQAPPNPAELLASENMGALLTSLEPKFDYIMIDTPPISLVTDALVLKNIIDGYVMVVRAGFTQSEVVKENLARIQQLEAPILGFILNDINDKTSYKKYYYRSYGKYGKYGYGGKYSYNSYYVKPETHQPLPEEINK